MTARLDLSVSTWRARAIRYVGIYLLLALSLVAARYFTQEVRPGLRAAQEREAALTTERDELELRVQALSNPQRVRDWAFANGMHRFAEAPKTTAELTGVPTPLPLSARTTVEVTTAWR